MHLIASILFTAFGVGLLALAIWHESTWFRRRTWTEGEGAIVGFSETHDDGVSYHSEIEFEGPSGSVRFVSKYGSSKKPEVGRSVSLVIAQSGENAEEYCLSNRILFTVVPILFGLILILVGVNIQPNEEVQNKTQHHKSDRAGEFGSGL